VRQWRLIEAVYQSATADEAELCLGELEAKLDDVYLPIGEPWRRNWVRITPFFDFPPEIRKVIYTANAIESVSMSPHIAGREPAYHADWLCLLQSIRVCQG
jgi:transposase-like protein